MDITIRLGTPSDLDTIKQIIHDAYSHYIPRIGTTPGPMRDDYAPMIAARNLYVAEDAKGTIQGLVAVSPREDFMMLSNLAVAPTAQGVGLGRKLIQFAEKLAGDCGYKVIKLYTNELMTENIQIYGKKGYVETHRGEERGLKRVYMSKTLETEPGQ